MFQALAPGPISPVYSGPARPGKLTGDLSLELELHALQISELNYSLLQPGTPAAYRWDQHHSGKCFRSIFFGSKTESTHR
jgi:hypothetical protein